jgi:YhcH/YjgK/YiaL family protein
MLIDMLENAGSCFVAGEAIGFALNWLRSEDIADLKPGTYELRGRDIYAIVAEYEPKPPEACRLETHRRYIDVQYVARGLELMGHARASALEPDGPYDEARDVQFYRGASDFTPMREGMFAIFYPEDAHMPGVAPEGPVARVGKIVVKVAAKEY